jgi:hypothetical protein
MADAVRHMGNAPADNVDHPPAKVPQPRIDAQHPHSAASPFSEGLARKGNIDQTLWSAG